MTVAATNNTFWDAVKKTESFYKPDSSIIIKGTKSKETAKELRDEMFNSSKKIDQHALEFFESPPRKVLDLGSGIGVNTRPMAKHGAHVTAIDSSKKLLQIFLSQSNEEACPQENIRRLNADITAMDSYGEDFDLVVAVDILPYIAPNDLQSTMEKIHACLVDKGILIGTIFTADIHPHVRDFMSKLGAHFYEWHEGGEKFTEQLLVQSGFLAEKIEECEDGFSFKAVKV